MNEYQGADIQIQDGAWWIIHDNGKAGPYSTLEAAEKEANIGDDDFPMEGRM